MNNPDLLRAFLSVQSGGEKRNRGRSDKPPTAAVVLLVCHTVSVSLSRFVFLFNVPAFRGSGGPDRV